MLLLNLITWLRLRNPNNISERELLMQLLGDIATLTALFYFTGGYSNPFVWMYLLPLTIGAVALQRLHAWLLAALAVICYSLLVFFYVPLSHLHMHYQEGRDLDIHLVGMWMGFVLSAGIIAVFVTRIGQNLRDYDHMIADAREHALESERMMALGTLAASAAHELGTPLATMAVLAKELQLDFAKHEDASKKLSILSAQISRCKEILSSLSASSGQGRADSGQALPISEFLDLAVARWRDTRPETALNYQAADAATDLPIFADRTLTQALQNLLDNAADASPERITMQAEWNDKELKIHIRDYGAGLTAEALDKAGTPFFTSKDKQGLGLGLYLTRAILARYNGSLELNNHGDGGVLTYVYLPLTQLKTSGA
jgi:two-component system sensor histidine kinase RegB